jgi:ketosteroid isomerase-like protein
MCDGVRGGCCPKPVRRRASCRAGLLLVGTVAIRQALQQMIDSGARVWLEPRNIRRVDDLAPASNTATVTEPTPEAKPVAYTTTEILRRQPDGGWLRILDDPFFG